MDSFLLNRQLGSISQQAFAHAQNNRLLQAIQVAPSVRFALKIHSGSGREGNDGSRATGTAHAAGVNAITIDRFEGRYLLSGGADSSVALWDLESEITASDDTIQYIPLSHVSRSSTTESLGITHISFYPFDSMAFLTSSAHSASLSANVQQLADPRKPKAGVLSYDRTVKLFSSETLKASATFDLGSTVYSHATSVVATHLLVACATQLPAVRLVDLRTGSFTHSLAGHAGSVLTVAWHPRNENILASGATDGTCRLWDIRRSASSLGMLDSEDSIGIAGHGTGSRSRQHSKAHSGSVNGVAWTEDGHHLVTAGHDECMRVWDMSTGANTLANFGPAIRNKRTLNLAPLVAPRYLSPAGGAVVYYPNPTEILSFDLHSGVLLKRLRVATLQTTRPTEGSVRNTNSQTTSLVWRPHHVEMISSHADGTIRSWRPEISEDAAIDLEEESDAEDDDHGGIERKRKREELDQIVQDLMRKRATHA